MSSISLEEIQGALVRGEIVPYMQPQYDATTGLMVGVEALARWVKPDGEVLSPISFIPQLEKSEAINELDWRIAEKAFEVLYGLRKQDISMSVNFSRWHLKEHDFVNRLVSLVDSFELPHNKIHVEITESALALSEENISEWVNAIHKEGFVIALDDFGSGLSNLGVITELPIDVIKLDKSLINNDCRNEKTRIIVEAILYGANRLGVDTVAEGIETAEQLKFLQTCNCKKMQGFLFAKPMPVRDFQVLAVGSSNKPHRCVDVVDYQTYASVMQLMTQAVFKQYPLIIMGNLSRNSYYMLAQENFTSTYCAPSGSFDSLIEHGTETMHPDDKEAFSTTFSKSNLIKAFKSGIGMVSLIVNQKGDDGVYRKVEVTDYFVTSAQDDDIIVISFSKNI